MLCVADLFFLLLCGTCGVSVVACDPSPARCARAVLGRAAVKAPGVSWCTRAPVFLVQVRDSFLSHAAHVSLR
jgi:hypothetical protein